MNSGINTDQIDTRNVPGYLSHYQLLRPPFSTEIEDDMYYPDPGQKQRLDLILHLTQFSDDVLILIGDMGCGKTTLAHQFVTQSHPNWKVCSVNATISMTPGHLLKQLNKHFEFSPQSQLNEDTLQSFKLDLAHQGENSTLHILLIDDAHLLSSDTFRLVMDLSTAVDTNGKHGLSIVLFAEPTIKSILLEPDLADMRFAKTRKMEIPTLSEEHSKSLIRHRLYCAGAQKNLLTDSVLEKIHSTARGNPGLLCQLTHEMLESSTPRDKANRALQESPAKLRKRMGRIVISAGLLASIILVLAFQKEISHFFAAAPTTKPLAVHEKIIDLPRPQSLRTITTDDLSSQTASVTDDISEMVQNLSDEQDDTAPAPGSQTLDDSDWKAIQLAANENKQKQTVDENHNAADLNQLGHDLAWITKQPDSNFTLQLIAGYQVNTLENFIRSHKIEPDDLAYYQSINKQGKAWHSLLYGSFSNLSSARRAAEQLSDRLNGNKPWIRRFSNIHKEMQTP